MTRSAGVVMAGERSTRGETERANLEAGRRRSMTHGGRSADSSTVLGMTGRGQRDRAAQPAEGTTMIRTSRPSPAVDVGSATPPGQSASTPGSPTRCVALVPAAASDASPRASMYQGGSAAPVQYTVSRSFNQNFP